MLYVNYFDITIRHDDLVPLIWNIPPLIGIALQLLKPAIIFAERRNTLEPIERKTQEGRAGGALDRGYIGFTLRERDAAERTPPCKMNQSVS